MVSLQKRVPTKTRAYEEVVGVCLGDYMSYSLSSLKGGMWRIISGSVIGVIKGDPISLDYISYRG